MKTQEIRIEIVAAHRTVFEFTLEPGNTPKWVTGVSKETVDTEQIGLGTIYSNEYRKLRVTDYERDFFFELSDEETGYQCSYTFHKIDDEHTELVYFECMQDGSELAEPMKQEYFETLKALLEN